MKSDREYFDHIIEEIDVIISNTSGISQNDFVSNPILKRAITRSIEVIGEAVKNLSDDIKRRYPDIEWRKIADTRNRLIHGYFAIDYDIVWDIIKNKIPELKKYINNIKIHEKRLFE